MFCLLAILGVAAAALPATAGARAHPKRRCSFRHAHSVARDSAARVFYFSSEGDRDFGGCLVRRGIPPYVAHDGLDVEGSSDVVEFPKLAGPYLAIADGFLSDAGAPSFKVELYDLRRARRFDRSVLSPREPFRRRAVRVAKAPAVNALTVTGHSDVTALALSRSGALAWIGKNLDSGALEARARPARTGRPAVDRMSRRCA